MNAYVLKVKKVANALKSIGASILNAPNEELQTIHE